MDWTQFAVKQEMTESSYNAKIAGTNRLGAGTHEVTLAAVEKVEDGDFHAYDMVWEDSEGSSFKERAFVTWPVKDDNGQPTSEREVSDSFVRLGLALAGGDVLLSKQFFLDPQQGAYINPGRMQACISNKILLTIGLPKSGFTTKNLGNSKYVVVDIETGEVEEDLGEFSSFKEMAEHCKEEGIKLAYNRVKFHKVLKDAAESNKQQISDNFSNVSSTGGDAPTIAPKPTAVQGF